MYCQSSKLLTTQESLNVLLDSDLGRESVCTEVPFGVNVNAAFVVDLSMLKSSRDVLCDDMGTWSWGGSFRRWCTVASDGTTKILGKRLSPSDIPPGAYQVWKRYYYLKGSPDVKKMVVFLHGELCCITLTLILLCLCLIVW